MQKKWVWTAVLALVALAGGGAAVVTGVFKGGDAQAKADGKATAKGEGKAEKTAENKGGKDDKKPEVPLEFLPTEIVQPRTARLPGLVEFSGPLVAPQTAMVRAKASGTLLSLTVGEGSRVKAGQVLGRIEQVELVSRVAERSASIESARAVLVQAERTHKSNESLAAQQFISQPALEQSRAALDTAKANVNAAMAAMDITKLSQRDGTLLAPISGIVAKRMALPGEKVSPEQQLLSIVDLAKLELAGSVGTHDVSRLSPGMEVQLQVEGVDTPVPGRIARIAPAAEPGTRSIGVTIELANPKEALRAGQYASVRATLADNTDRITLPSSAVGTTSGQDHVWMIENGALARRAVTIGKRDNNTGRVEVLQGVTMNSQVLGARFDNLREGAKAVVVASKSAAPPSAATAAASSAIVK
jgi:membrane fusion protein, multidrug efflux system